VLAQVGHEIIAELNGAGQAEDKIGQVITGGVTGNGAACRRA
jgi:hypothetical protein